MQPVHYVIDSLRTKVSTTDAEVYDSFDVQDFRL